MGLGSAPSPWGLLVETTLTSATTQTLWALAGVRAPRGVSCFWLKGLVESSWWARWVEAQTWRWAVALYSYWGPAPRSSQPGGEPHMCWGGGRKEEGKAETPWLEQRGCKAGTGRGWGGWPAWLTSVTQTQGPQGKNSHSPSITLLILTAGSN